MNYKSTSDLLRNNGFVLTNTCDMGGETYHDFNSRKKDACIALVVDNMTGSVKWVEVSTRKWDSSMGRYIPSTKKLYALADVVEMFRK